MPLSSLHEPFPIKLHGMLNEVGRHPDLKAIISWNSDGNSFTVHQPKLFASTIMLRYFSHTKYKSFQRQMNLYHFTRISRGQQRNTYAHDYFIRDNATLCKYICRTKEKSPSMMMPSQGAANETEAIMPMTLDSIYRTSSQTGSQADTTATKNDTITADVLQALPIDNPTTKGIYTNNAASEGVRSMGGAALSFDLSMHSFDLAPVGLKTELDPLVGSDLFQESKSGSFPGSNKSERSFDQDFWQLPLNLQSPLELAGSFSTQPMMHQQYPTLTIQQQQPIAAVIATPVVMQEACVVNTNHNTYQPATNNDSDDDASIGTIDDIQSSLLSNSSNAQDSSVIAV